MASVWRRGRLIAAASQNGATASYAADFKRGAALDRRDQPNQPIWLSPQQDVRGVSISPDGKWSASESYFTDPLTPQQGVKIWDCDNGRLSKQLFIPDSAVPLFSPDGAWLAVRIVNAKQIHLWSVGDWREQRRIDGINCAFTPNSKLLAVESGAGVLRLIDVRDGHTVASLEDPDQAQAASMVFSPDGTRLIFTSNDDQTIHVWDFLALRQGLSLLGLDWDQALHAATASRMQWVGTVQYFSAEPLKAPIQLRLTSFERLKTEVPFELRDVPLP